MLRWKLLKYLIAFLPLATVFLLPFVDPIKRQFLNRSDLRWYSSQDKAKRTQTIIVSNGGGGTMSSILVEFNIPPNAGKSVSDFNYSTFASTPRISFLDTLASPDTLTKLDSPVSAKILELADEHSNSRSLYAVDQVFDDLLVTRLQASKLPAVILDVIRQKRGNHNLWIQKCNEVKSAKPQCSLVDAVIGKWELEKRNLQVTACNKWREATGVKVLSSPTKLSPDNSLFFNFSLANSESAFLNIQYGPDALNPVTTKTSSTATEQSTQVTDLKDLSAPTWWIFAKYYPRLAISYVAAVLFGLFFAWPWLKPLSLLRIHKLFNFAVKTNDYEVWELAFRRHRYVIQQKFRSLCSEFEKEHLSSSPEELFDFLRYRLRASVGKHSTKFKSEEELNRFIHQELRRLVAYANS
jgi:hypothetical protein